MRLHQMPPAVRLAAAGFAVVYLAFALASQAQLWVQAGGGRMPTPERVLERYHGRADDTHLHAALDPTKDEDDPTAMYPFLGSDDEERMRHRATILSWVDAGAPKEGFAPVRAILTDPLLCAQCHVAEGSAPFPLETWEDVQPHARPGEGMAWPRLLTSAHNHLFNFGVAALLLSIGLAFSRAPARLRTLLIGMAFAGPLLDVGGWVLTRLYGSPWHLVVMAGGGLFGLATTSMAAWILLDVLRGPSRVDADAAAE
jgi:hypothetical protein